MPSGRGLMIDIGYGLFPRPSGDILGFVADPFAALAGNRVSDTE
jgi:hypothetical protein